LERAYSPAHHGRWSARRRSGLVDDAVRALAEGLEGRVAVVALGGYGRRMLCPGSDVDLMVLHGERRGDRVREMAERLFYPFWDAGFALGHAVRTVKECLSGARERIDTACSLLDARLVWGEAGLEAELAAGLRRSLRKNSAGFLRALRADAAKRHEEHPPCSAAVEPDLKEGSGGLRDINAIGWASAVLVDGSNPVEAGLLRAREAEMLDRAEEFLIRFRSALHLEAGRRAERPFLEHQPVLAERFGFQGGPGLDPTDALMRTLFEHAREVEHVTESFGWRADRRAGGEPPRHVDVPAQASPDDVMGAFATAAESGLPLSPASVDALEASDRGPSPERWTDATRRGFVEILGAAAAGARTLEAMDRSGVLGWFLPEWEAVRCRPQRDPYHRFTVDVHLMRAAAEAASILRGEEEEPALAAAAETVMDRDALLLGAFLHDIGKTGEGRHVPRGVEVAAAALERMGAPKDSRDRSMFLVAQHLLLGDTATRRDLSDENLVLDVAAAVGDPERLAMLYVLSVADARATGPHASTPWRMALVRELVGKVEHVLESGEMGSGRAAMLADRLVRIRELLGGEERASVDAYLERLPRPYLLGVSPEMAAAHFGLVTPPLSSAEVRTASSPGSRPGTHELTVVAPDRPGLLAKISGALSLGGLNILSAQAFTTEDGVAIDVFVVDPGGSEVDEERWRRIRQTLRKAMEGRLSLDYRLREQRRHYPAPRSDIPIRVRVLNDVSDFASVVEVEAPDRSGLLFDITRAFEELGLDVHVAKVATYGVRVVDAFYVRDLFGRKVEEPEAAREIERAILARLSA
jgi:[protein-PII] uridylyltransferase